MSDASPDFSAALDELRFDDARALLDDAPEGERDGWAQRLRAAYEDAVDEAELLANRIQLLAREDHYAALFDLSNDPMTARRLSLLPDELRRGATIHLNGARRRREQSLRSARNQLRRAREALDGFHTGNARQALARVDETWLEPDDEAELAALRTRLDLVKAETDELAALAGQALAEHEESSRWLRRRGCLSSVLAALAVLGVVVAVVVG